MKAQFRIPWQCLQLVPPEVQLVVWKCLQFALSQVLSQLLPPKDTKKTVTGQYSLQKGLTVKTQSLKNTLASDDPYLSSLPF